MFATFGDDVQLKTCSFGVCVDAIKYDKHIYICGMHYAQGTYSTMYINMRFLKIMIVPNVKVLG